MNLTTNLLTLFLCLGYLTSSAQLIENFNQYSWQQKDSIIETLYHGGAKNVVNVIIDQAYEAERTKVSQDLEALAALTVWKGIKELSESNLVEAQNTLQTAVEIYEQKPAIDRLRYQDALINLSDIYRERGDALLAFRSFAKALDLLDVDTMVQASMMHSSYQHASDLALQAGEYNEAESYGKKALSLSQTEFTNRSNEYFQSLTRLGLIYRAQGQLRRASNLILQAYDMAKTHLPDDDPNKVYYANLAIEDLERNGRSTAAEEVYKEQLAFYDKYSQYQDDISYPVLLNQLGDFYSTRGDLDLAYDYYNRANILFELRTDNTDPRYIQSQANVARILQQQGKYVEAELYYLAALRYAGDAFDENSWTEGYIRDNLATMYAAMDKPKEALEQRRLANKIIEVNLGPNHPEYAVSTLNIGEAYLALGQDSLASDFLTTAYVKLDQLYGPRHARVFTAAHSLADYYAERDVKLALDYYGRAADFVDYHFLNVLPLLPTAERLSSLERYKKFIDKYFSFGYQHHSENPTVGSKMYNTALAYQHAREALDIPTTLALTKEPTADLRKSYNQWKALRSQIIIATEKTVAERTEMNVDLNELFTDIQAIEKTMFPAYLNNHVGRESDGFISSLKARLQSGEVLVNFFPMHWFNMQSQQFNDQEAYLTFVLGPTSTKIDLIEIGLTQNVLDVEQSRGQSAYSQQIWSPLEDVLSSHQRLLIVPAKRMNLVAFGALATKDGSLVWDEFKIDRLSSPFALFNRSANTSIQDKVALVTNVDLRGNPTLADGTSPSKVQVPARVIAPERVRKNMPLKMTTVNADQVIAIATKTLGKKKELTILQNDQASKSNVNALATANTSMIHLITSGLLMSEDDVSIDTTTNLATLTSPWLKSALTLTGANQTWESDSMITDIIDDGILTSLELATLDLDKVDLTILDGLNLQQAQNADGAALLRLVRTLQMAGSKHVLVSLWPARDRDSYFQLFYKNLSKGKTVKDAFYLTQKKMRKKFDVASWAGYVLF
ncbi:MAG: tetratricopeptide repeat protein [Saprospiraceae bacterium]|nr:tetratricopeptide repeat protein [Saprospiraceae bacterium]